MKTIQTEVYELDELSDKAKEKAREWYREGDELTFLPDYLESQLMELLVHNNIECSKPKVYFSLSSSQGDGVMFEGVGEFKGHDFTVTHSGRYYHKYSRIIDWPDFTGEDKESREEAIAKEFEEIYTKICTELEKQGYNFIEEERSNESVDDNIRANEYTFTKDGKRFG